MAITPACGYVTVGSSMVIGFVASMICYAVGVFFNERSGIDDSLDVFTIHGVGGTVGVICTGIFCSKNINAAGADGLIYGEGLTLGKHLAVVVVIIPCIMISTYMICVIVNLIIPMRKFGSLLWIQILSFYLKVPILMLLLLFTCFF